MASSQTQQKTAQSPFNLFRGAAWNPGKKKAKQAKLGDENSMYFHPELKRWVEKGKEEDAEREATPAPPPVVAASNSGSFTTTPTHKRSLSQRYVLQPNLSISSSMASLAGSMSQNDLFNMAGPGYGEGSFSGPASARGSTAPSPPQSGSCLTAFASGPPSAAGTGGPAASLFFVPPSPQQGASPPSGRFFVPPPPTPEDGPLEDGSFGAAQAEEAGRPPVIPTDLIATHISSNAEEVHPPPDTHDLDHRAVSLTLSSAVELSLRNSLVMTSVSTCASPLPDERPVVDVPGDQQHSSVSFPDTLESRQVESPVALRAAGGLQSVALFSAEARRMDRFGPNASDGGAAISLHEGMGVAPVRPSAGVGRFEAAADALPAEDAAAGGEVMDDGAALADYTETEPVAALEEYPEPAEPVAADEPAATSEPVDGSAEAAAADSGAAPADAPADHAGAALHSQYYYQQYAYLYQYALEQGYGEADAVTYAQYYAATYAQQYEAQAPEGQIGAGGTPEGDTTATAAQQEQQPQDGQGAGEVVVANEVSEPAAAVSGPALALGEAAVEVAPVVLVTEPRSAEDQVYWNAVPAAVVHNAVPVVEDAPAQQSVLEPEAVPMLFSAAPLPDDLAAAATAATHHHQSAVTAAVAAAAAAVENQLQVDELQGAGLGQAGMVAATSAVASGQPNGTSGPQLLMGLGAAGAKRLTQLSSAATAAVASLGATVAAAAPVAAALSAASAAASSAAAAAAAGMGLEGGMTDDDFERIMHPGDPAKLDGPLPWELPEHLRSGRKFLALCANWQLANPGLPYEPHLLLQQQLEALAGAQDSQQAERAPGQGGDVALAAEGGSGSAGGAAAAPQEQQPAEAEELSSYERACRLAQFGQPVPGLAPQLVSSGAQHGPAAAAQHKQHDAAVPAAAKTAPVPHADVVPQPEEAAAAPAAGRKLAAAAVGAARPLDLGLLDSPTVLSDGHPTPGSARSGDPFAGAEHMSLSDQYCLHASPLDSPARVPYAGLTLEEVTEESDGDEPTPSVAASASLPPMSLPEPNGLFVQLSDEATVSTMVETATDIGHEIGHDVSSAKVSAVVFGEAQDLDVPKVPATAATAAAAAIDTVVQALEQLRFSAAAANGDADAASQDSTALLLQIHSSLAQATQALAGMGVDVSALASLAGAAQLQTPAATEEWTPTAGHKRPRMDASPATPTRPATNAAAAEGVLTPLLAPGPPAMRPAPEETGPDAPLAPAAGAGERFQLLGRRLSGASAEGAGATAGHTQLQQLEPVVVSLTVVAGPEVDVAAVEERARSGERAVWEARLDAVVDSERESAAFVIASVEQERDRLQLQVGDLERKLATAQLAHDALVQRLACSEAETRQALAAQTEAESQRAALVAHASATSAERDELSVQLSSERLEKAALAEALASARAESEDLRRQYTERFSSLASELEATRGSLAELQSEHDELLLCLGQESTKVAVLTEALRDTGCDPEPMLERVEAEYETMGLGAAEAGGEDAAEASEQL